jgi:hypothetical protein
MEPLDQRVHPTTARTNRTASSPPRPGRSDARGRIGVPPNRQTQKEAEAALLIAWREWLENTLPKKIGDGEVHAFLRLVKTERPELLVFPSKITPYETAFRWIVGAHADLEPMRSRF